MGSWAHGLMGSWAHAGREGAFQRVKENAEDVFFQTRARDADKGSYRPYHFPEDLTGLRKEAALFFPLCFSLRVAVTVRGSLGAGSAHGPVEHGEDHQGPPQGQRSSGAGSTPPWWHGSSGGPGAV